MDNYQQYSQHGFVGQQNQAQSNLSPYILHNLKQTATWMRVISVILFVLTAIVFLFAIFIIAAGSGTRRIGVGSSISSAVGILYILLAVIIYLIPGILLMIHANSLSNFSVTNSLIDLDNAVSKGKSYWTYIGVLALIVTIIFFIGIIIAIAAAS
ncbi:MAG: hypothetical protein N2490_00720 [Ignavibacteria bacterium]|nr:hypothetical protein [Ignavibacteria bacterium]